MRKITLVVLLVMFSLAASIAVAITPQNVAAANDTKAAVEQVLRVQQDAWNRHDLDGFMAGYWNSPELTFFSGGTEKHGWQETMDRYRATYTSPGHEMGKLEFPGCALRCCRRMLRSCAGRGI